MSRSGVEMNNEPRVYTYFIQEDIWGDGPIKIGSSKNPEHRVKCLQAGNSRVLRLLLKVPGNHIRRLYGYFAEERIYVEGFTTEWFEPSKRLLVLLSDLDGIDCRNDILWSYKMALTIKEVTRGYRKRRLKKYENVYLNDAR